MDAITYRRATFGSASCVVDVALVKLHWNPFMYTTSWLVDLAPFRIYIDGNPLCSEPESGWCIQCHAQMHLPFGHGGISAGISKCV